VDEVPSDPRMRLIHFAGTTLELMSSDGRGDNNGSNREHGIHLRESPVYVYCAIFLLFINDLLSVVYDGGAAGVEPASENVTGQETTCLFAFMPQSLGVATLPGRSRPTLRTDKKR